MRNGRAFVFKLTWEQIIVFVLVSLFLSASKPVIAEHPAESLTNKIESMADDSNKVNALINVCQNYPVKHSKKHRNLIYLLLETSTLIHQDFGTIQANIYLSEYYFAIKNYDSALIYIRTSKRRSKDYGITSFLFEIYLKEAIIHRARFDVAGEKESLQRAKLFSEDEDDKAKLAKVFLLTGEFNLRLNRYYPAIVYLKKAINLLKLENDKPNLFHSYSTLSDIYILRSEHSLAIKTITEAINNPALDLSHDSILGHLYSNLGLALYHIDNFQESLANFKTAESLMPKPSQCLTIYNNLFLIYNKNNNVSKQKEYLNKINRISSPAISQSAYLLAKNKKLYFIGIGNCDSATAFFDQAISLSQLLEQKQQTSTIKTLSSQQKMQFKRAIYNTTNLEEQFNITKNETSKLLFFVSFISLLVIATSLTFQNLLPKLYVRYSYYLLLLTVTINILIHFIA